MPFSSAVAAVCAALAVSFPGALSAADKRPSKPMKIVQVDLARQMETTSFLSNYVDCVAALGFDTLHLYVEGRIATKSFALPSGESYTAEEMRQLVEYAASKGLVSVPCVGLLGHANLFFKYPGLEGISETHGCTPRLGKGNDTFCISKPETREFLKRYVAEVAELFPGPYFNVGLDEAWNAGVCPLCAPKEKRDELFTETILFAHEAVSAVGKRMWMWDDFFEFHPKALDATPRDVVICHWNYNPDVSPLGSRGHFAGRHRRDWLGTYSAMGFDTIPACWFPSGNAETLHAYARRHRTIGFMATQWEEMFVRFPNGSLPRIAAVSLLLATPPAHCVQDPYPDAVGMILPSLTPAENAAVVSVFHNERVDTRAGLASLATAVEVLKRSALAGGEVDPDPFSQRAILDDIICRAEGDLISGRIAALKPVCADPRRTAEEVRAVKAELPALSAAADRLSERRLRQAELWRAGLDCSGKIDRPAADAKKAIAALMAVPEAPAPEDERRLLVNLVLPEYYGIPRWKIHGRFADGWRELAAGTWKPRQSEPAVFERAFAFKSDAMPSELRVEHSGYGRAQLAYVSIDDRSSRYVPVEVLSVVGDVEHAERLLADNQDWADFGTCGFREKFFDAEKAAKVSSVTLRMAPMTFPRCHGREPLRIALTFDDSLKDHLLVAAPMLEERGWRGTFCIVTDWVGRNPSRNLSWDDVRELVRRGHEIAVHTKSHRNLVDLLREGREDEVRREIGDAVDVVQKEVGIAPRFMFAPFCQQNAETERICRELGLRQALSERCNFGSNNCDRVAETVESLLRGGAKRADFLHHGVSLADHGGWCPFVDRESFRRHLDAIAELERSGKVVVTDYDGMVSDCRLKAEPWPRHGVVSLSFDDKSFDQWEAAFPLFEKYGARTTFFVVGTNRIDFMKKALAAGHEIGSHGLVHMNATPTVEERGEDWFWDVEMAPQLKALAEAGVPIRSYAYPNCRRTDRTDAMFFERGIARVRGLGKNFSPNPNPHDPKGEKLERWRPLATTDGMFFPAADFLSKRLVPNVIMGESYHTDIEDIMRSMARAGDRGEVVFLVSHGISGDAKGISMKTEWLERMLSSASDLGVLVRGIR